MWSCNLLTITARCEPSACHVGARAKEPSACHVGARAKDSGKHWRANGVWLKGRQAGRQAHPEAVDT